jgi:hypothetical protein
MRKYLVCILLAASMAFVGCATIQDTTLTPAQKAQRIVSEDGPMIKAGVELCVQAIVQFSYDSPEKRAEIKEELHRVSEQVAVLCSGDLSPAGLVTALKVKEDYVARVLQAIVPLYSAGYQRLKSVGEADLAVQYLRLIAEGIRDGTK